MEQKLEKPDVTLNLLAEQLLDGAYSGTDSKLELKEIMIEVAVRIRKLAREIKEY